MVLYSKFAYGSQFSGEKKTVCKSVTWFTSYAKSRIQENSCVFFLNALYLLKIARQYPKRVVKICNTSHLKGVFIFSLFSCFFSSFQLLCAAHEVMLSLSSSVFSCFRVSLFFSFSVLGVCSAFGMSYNESFRVSMVSQES